ncbi:MAG: tRNA (N(6)-L-threonylcarbamoyladenosine(37)-C(2))-methylthiotransferase MtaB, partial [Pseudomonadota bacterium]|nr:tRNA (N(6)-L-threonylcarbamoyladenosine(37)-C(2))-methylthiotransferase MtaB [Pseudomonadota bacterium]
AARMPQVDHPIRKERAARLREAGERQVDALLRKHVNSTREVIVEAGNIGRTEHFLPVKLDKDLEQGTLATVEISDKIEDGKLIGRVV